MAKVTVNLRSDFAINGVQDAATIMEAIRKGETVMKDVFLERAGELSEDAQKSADWLEGLKQGLIKEGMSKGTATNRKSDAAAIFNAVHVAHESVEAIQGGYHDLVKECRSIVAQHNNKPTTARNTGPRKLTDADKNKVVKRLLDADNSPSTALEIMTAAQTAYIKAAGTPEGLVRQADNLAMELQKSGDKFYHTLGERISKLTQSAIEHAEKERAKHIEGQKQTQERLEKAAAKPKVTKPIEQAPAQADTEEQQAAAQG